MTAHGIMFHHFHDARHPRGQGAMSADDLVRMIRQLGRSHILDAEIWMERALTGRLAADDICFTFDDGLRCQCDVALPVLEDFGIKAFWFVYSSVFEGMLELLEVYRYFRSVEFEDIDDFYAVFLARASEMYPKECEHGLAEFDPDCYLVDFPIYTINDRIFRYLRNDVLGPEKYSRIMDPMIAAAGYDTEALCSLLWLTDEDLAALAARGHVIGLHSFSHPVQLERLPAHVQRREYRQNYAHLCSILAAPPQAMSHPCNSYNADTLSVLQDLGIRLGFRSNMARRGASLFEFPREDHANIMKRIAQ